MAAPPPPAAAASRRLAVAVFRSVLRWARESAGVPVRLDEALQAMASAEGAAASAAAAPPPVAFLPPPPGARAPAAAAAARWAPAEALVPVARAAFRAAAAAAAAEADPVARAARADAALDAALKVLRRLNTEGAHEVLAARAARDAHAAPARFQVGQVFRHRRYG
jgi:hypothetical protein